jgi:hypothetical protein
MAYPWIPDIELGQAGNSFSLHLIKRDGSGRNCLKSILNKLSSLMTGSTSEVNKRSDRSRHPMQSMLYFQGPDTSQHY